jgi:hypothetical protein
MSGIVRDYLIGVISSVSAAILLVAIGFTEVRRRAKRTPASAVRWIKLVDHKGSIRDGLRPSVVLLALILALAMTTGTAFLSSGVTPIESKTPDILYFEADNAVRMATNEANGNFRMTENDVESTLRNSDQQADALRSGHDPKAGEKIKRMMAQATEHAEQLRKWNQQRNDELLKNAERRAETLRSQATQRDLPTKLKIGTRIAVFSESTLWGLLLIFFTGHLIRVFRLDHPQAVGFLAAGTLVLGIALCASLSGSSGVVNLFEPFLIAAALFISLGRDLSFGEVLLNAGYVVFQRFYSAIGIAITGALSALATASGLFGVIYIGYKILHSDDTWIPSGFSPPPVIRVGSLFYVLDIGTLSTLLDFFELFASALCLGAFFSVLAGREPLKKPAYDFSGVDLSGHAPPELSSLRLSPIRRLLLLYRPVGIRAWVAHFLFYLTLVTFVLGARLFGDQWDENAALTSLFLFQLVIAFCFRYWAKAELGWRSNNAPRLRDDRSWTPQPSSGRELAARIFAIIAGAKAVQCLCLLVIAFFVQDDSSAFDDLSPMIIVLMISMTYAWLFCRRWNSDGVGVVEVGHNTNATTPPLFVETNRDAGTIGDSHVLCVPCLGRIARGAANVHAGVGIGHKLSNMAIGGEYRRFCFAIYSDATLCKPCLGCGRVGKSNCCRHARSNC